MDTELFIGGLAILTFAALIIVAMTSNDATKRSFEVKRDGDGGRKG